MTVLKVDYIYMLSYKSLGCFKMKIIKMKIISSLIAMFLTSMLFIDVYRGNFDEDKHSWSKK